MYAYSLHCNTNVVPGTCNKKEDATDIFPTKESAMVIYPTKPVEVIV